MGGKVMKLKKLELLGEVLVKLFNSFPGNLVRSFSMLSQICGNL
jgi:hypothetical protein